jgi:hypothetical protein
MSYLQTEGFARLFDWSGGSGESGEVASKATRIDFSAMRAAQKKEMFSKFGYYKNADGSPMRFENGRVQPVTSYVNGWGLLEYWQKVGEELLATETMTAAKATSGAVAAAGMALGVNISLMSIKASLALVKQANDRFKQKANMWRLGGVSGLSVSQEARRADDLWDEILSNYAIELANVIWVSDNIETALSRALWAAKESAAEVGKALASPVIEVIKKGQAAVDWFIWVTKLAVYGTLGLLGLWGVSKIMKKRAS